MFEALTLIVMNSLRLAYVQIRLRDAVRHPWPLNENIPVFDTLSHIYTGLLSLFDLPAFGKHRYLSWDRVKLAEDQCYIVLNSLAAGAMHGCTNFSGHFRVRTLALCFLIKINISMCERPKQPCAVKRRLPLLVRLYRHFLH